ncbi:hypothetical protein [Streptomyces sp. NPDC059009]|uniref:hypothetical protein n=1 Tax=Streptomyces sp. NPDC059009 TaxID=3346694 RepID=UPI0036B8D955
MSSQPLRSAIAATRPVFTHLETEWLFEIILSSGHKEADYLVNKLVRSSGGPELYARTRQRIAQALEYRQEAD